MSSTKDLKFLNVLELGVMEYRQALSIQEKIHSKIVESDELDNVIICVEHPNVLTMGKHGDSKNILDANNIDIVQIDRGGDVTAHIPGQLVVYPIINTAKFDIGPKNLICNLEKAIIQTLKKLGLQGECKPEYPGVWIKNRKIAAVGVRIKRRTSMHGLSMNICNQFDVFDKIIPCGIKEFGVTSIQEELGKVVLFDDGKELFMRSLGEVFEPRQVCRIDLEDIL
ncbi:lipoyl(octanoyl) transferase LipB [Dolichospermum sp. ST_sed1]|nr:lipoyl(octanoyl) transferase LipB [Dolichospermum sp. ST_sed1]